MHPISCRAAENNVFVRMDQSVSLGVRFEPHRAQPDKYTRPLKGKGFDAGSHS
jgi:hypothetical protein